MSFSLDLYPSPLQPLSSTIWRRKAMKVLVFGGANLLSSANLLHKKFIVNSSNPSPSPRERDIGRSRIKKTCLT